ncbi:MAG: hypothetical protein EHM20_11645 [Alphaproteobacteria bacterium]|nr:MAG: hypothetical protein EHM20_11645 [Alphaproteobacteria bacterium]
MQCTFLDLVREQRPDGEETDTKTKDCTAGFTDFTLEHKHVDYLCETDEFSKCPRFQARVIIHQGNLTKQTQSDDSFISTLKLPCIFLSSKKVNSGTSQYMEYDCKLEFQKFKPGDIDHKKYCSNEHFLECPRFQARIMIHQDQ